MTMKIMIPLYMLIFALAGCMRYDEARVGSLGYSVYDTHYQQIADKPRAASPGTAVSSAGIDGPLTEKVGRPIQINIGN